MYIDKHEFGGGEININAETIWQSEYVVGNSSLYICLTGYKDGSVLLESPDLISDTYIDLETREEAKRYIEGLSNMGLLDCVSEHDFMSV